jgi:hypothetical protein
MYKKLGQFALPVLMFAFVGTAQAEVIDFGPGGNSFFTPIPAWDVYYVDTTNPTYNAAGYISVAGATGNQWVATNYRESPLAGFVSAGGLFDLDGLWLAGAYGNQTLTITGYLNGVAVDSVTQAVTQTAQQFTFNGFKGIDSFSIATGVEGNYWALGSVMITVVPEPEAYAMLLAGLGMVGVMARRRRKN